MGRDKGHLQKSAPNTFRIHMQTASPVPRKLQFSTQHPDLVEDIVASYNYLRQNQTLIDGQTRAVTAMGPRESSPLARSANPLPSASIPPVQTSSRPRNPSNPNLSAPARPGWPAQITRNRSPSSSPRGQAAAVLPSVAAPNISGYAQPTNPMTASAPPPQLPPMPRLGSPILLPALSSQPPARAPSPGLQARASSPQQQARAPSPQVHARPPSPHIPAQPQPFTQLAPGMPVMTAFPVSQPVVVPPLQRRPGSRRSSQASSHQTLPGLNGEGNRSLRVVQGQSASPLQRTNSLTPSARQQNGTSRSQVQTGPIAVTANAAPLVAQTALALPAAAQTTQNRRSMAKVRDALKKVIPKAPASVATVSTAQLNEPAPPRRAPYAQAMVQGALMYKGLALYSPKSTPGSLRGADGPSSPLVPEKTALNMVMTVCFFMTADTIRKRFSTLRSSFRSTQGRVNELFDDLDKLRKQQENPRDASDSLRKLQHAMANGSLLGIESRYFSADNGQADEAPLAVLAIAFFKFLQKTSEIAEPNAGANAVKNLFTLFERHILCRECDFEDAIYANEFFNLAPAKDQLGISLKPRNAIRQKFSFARPKRSSELRLECCPQPRPVTALRIAQGADVILLRANKKKLNLKYQCKEIATNWQLVGMLLKPANEGKCARFVKVQGRKAKLYEPKLRKGSPNTFHKDAVLLMYEKRRATS